MSGADTTKSAVRVAAERIAAAGESRPRPARDPVNLAMVHNWVEAIGDTNPVYTDAEVATRSVHGGLVAPPAMAQVWTMYGLRGGRADDDPLGAMMAALDAEGFTSVVATNSEQTYHRYLRHGEHVSATTRLESVVGPKRTALGAGWFVTTRTNWYVGDELVADMLFRVLKFRPPGAGPPGPDQPDQPDQSEPGRPESAERAGASAGPEIRAAGALAAGVLRPVVSRDTEFFWAGTRVGELRIQRWGDTLRHPPGPMPPGGDLTARPDHVVAEGTGTVYSYVVHHHPPVPGKRLPFVVALVELTEGVRVLGELVDTDPENVHIGMPVEVVFLRVDDELTLPAWRPR
ncbi:hypothetical protein SAMN05421810_104438 [Amycolatopsis arida]|uniref:DNA-binding protein n=1 Tax=Amycolatopsis arida TaxID=587909 RepID=A0A1I5VM50_9PSEU|nr:OB-fold domain-containing protein [Amycolatopsis arida]TDX87951.1 hypothetical protein CLV69_11284 [Amycolatopsis arida]SFQ08624.1 hypothetical protein SAMN05421810_104438 [Amycolatopsis arida]